LSCAGLVGIFGGVNDIFDLAHLELWLAFGVAVVVLLLIDLLVAHRHAHVVSIREAAAWSALWIGVSLLFNAGVWWLLGGQRAMEFLAAYLVEKSLSVDNLFVFVVIFRTFGVGPIYQHRVLFWGVVGAIVMRVIMITAGVALVHRFHWILYLFGAFLVYTAVKLAMTAGQEAHPEKSAAVRLARRWFRVAPGEHGEKFWARSGGRLAPTMLFVTLIAIEISDLIFAVDSIPTVFGISTDAFVIITSNIFAILGLRALYFLLAGTIYRFHYLSHGLAVVLGFIGIKMLIGELVEIPTWISLLVVAGVITIAILLSLRMKKEEGRDSGPNPPPSGEIQP